MLQVPPTGAPTARITSRAPQTDPSDLAFAGMMAQAALPGSHAAPRPPSPSRPTATDKSPAPPEAEGGKATERPEASPGDSSAAERSENTDSKPASEKEAAPSVAAPDTPNASLSAKIVSEPLPTPILPGPATAAPPQVPVPAGSMVAGAIIATTEKTTPNVLPSPRGSDLAIEAVSPPGLPESAETLNAPAAPGSIPAPATEAKAPEAIRALPPPNPAPAPARAETKVDLPVQAKEKGETPQPLPTVPGPASGKSVVPDAPATPPQAGMAGVQAQPAEAGRTKEAFGKSAGFSISEESPRIHEPSPGAGSQKNLGDLAKGMQGQLNLTEAGDPVPRNEAAPQFQISRPLEEAPSPAGLPKSHVLEPMAAAEASPKEQPLPRAQETPAPHNPVPTAVVARDSAVALPRSESLGLQPTQGGMAAVALPREAQAATAKAPAQMQWQAPVPSLVNQVEGGIRWMLRSSTQGAELQLHPENLGRVRIELKVEGSEVHARLWASDPKSLPILQDNKAFLEVSLREQGLNLGSFDLRQNPQQAQTRQQPSDIPGQFWATEAPKQDFRQETPILAGVLTAQARRLEIFV